MKTKNIFLIVCILAGTALLPLSAQKNDTSSDAFWVQSVYYYTPVRCDGAFVDWVEGEFKIHVVNHYKDGVWIFQRLQISGVGTGYLSGETFKFKMKEKYSDVTGMDTWHYNLKGDEGSHFIGSMTYDYSTGSFTVNKTVCH